MAKSIAVKVKHIAPKKEKSGTPQLTADSGGHHEHDDDALGAREADQ